MAHGNLKEANAALREVIRAEPSDWKAHVFLGDLLMKQSQPGEASKHFKEAVRLNPGEAGTLYDLGLSLEEQGEHAEASRAVEEALSIDPKMPAAADAYLIWGMALERTGQLATGEA